MADIKVTQKEEKPVVVEAKVSYKDLTPANWTLVSEGEDLVSGVNLKSGETFLGTIAEFNEILKG